MMEAVKGGDIDNVTSLLDIDDINIQDNLGRTALIWAIRYVHIDIVRLLLDKGADPNIPDEFRKTPLIWASLGDGHIEIVKLLLDRGVDINIVSKYGQSALAYASYFGNTDIVKLLLDKGADPNIVDNDGKTALMNAIDNGNTDIVKLLKKHIATISMQALRRGKMTRRKINTSMTRKRSALSHAGYEYGAPDDVMQMVNSHMRGPGPSDMVVETPHNMRGLLKKKKKKRTKKRTKRRKSKKRKSRSKSKKRKSRKHK